MNKDEMDHNLPSASQSAAASTVDIATTFPTEYGTLYTTRSGSLGKITTPSESPQLSTDILSQSLTADVLRLPSLQRAMSTSPRLEHATGSQPLLDEKSQREEGLYFPFLESSQDADLSTSLPEVQGTTIQQLTSASPHTHSLTDNSMVGCTPNMVLGTSVPTGMSTGKERSGSVVSSTRSGIFGSGRFRFFSRNNSIINVNRPKPGTLRQDSALSTASSVYATSIFGSAMFGSPSKRGSVVSPRVNIVTDALSVYPSLVSLCSIDRMSVSTTPGTTLGRDLYAEAFSPISNANGHVSASYQDKIDQTEKLERSDSIVSAGSTPETDLSILQRSVSLPSKYAYPAHKGSFPSAAKIQTRENSIEKLEDEQIDELAELKSSLVGIVPSKKKWQQTMPDLVEGPESETLTMQSTTRNQLAMAALAIIRGEYKDDTILKDEVPELDEKKERKRYMKNLLVMGFVFFFVFTSYLSLRNLQSSLNDSGGLGMYALSCVYAFLFIGSIFTTTIVQRLRPKVSMLISMSGFFLYNLANFYPSFYTLIPAACTVGFSLAIIWTSQATYLANIATSFAELTGNTVQNVLSKFHGIFFIFFQSSQIVGGLISSLLLAASPHDLSNSNDTAPYTGEFDNSTSPTNLSLVVPLNVSVDEVYFCGSGYCHSDSIKKTSAAIDEYMIYLLMGIFLGCTLTGILVLLFFLDPLEGVMKKSHASIREQMFAVFKRFTKPNLLCLVGMMLYSLLQVSFMVGEFSKAYVTCTLGIQMVGYVMVCMSVSAGLFAYSMGILQKYIGRMVLILSALSVHLVLLIVMLLWHPTPDSLPVFFAIAAGWGAGDGIITTQLVSFIGTLFTSHKEAAFAAHKMTQSLGAFALFITGPYLCTRTKIYTLMVMLSLAAIGFVSLEMKLRLKSRKPADSVILKVEPSEKESSASA